MSILRRGLGLSLAVAGLWWVGVPSASAAALSPVSGSPFATGGQPYSVAFSPGGGRLAVANAADSTVGVFSVNRRTGALTAVSGSPFATDRFPFSVAFSSNGRLLATANDGANSVSVFSVNKSTGALTAVPGSPFAVGRDPDSVAFSPKGGLLAVTNSSDSNVSVFSVNQTTGALTAVSGSPFATGLVPQSLAFSPGGGLLAVANFDDQSISVFSVNQSTGALTEVTGSPFATGNSPHSVAFSRDGGLLATANEGGNSVSVFAVDQTTGALTEVSGSPFAAGTSPQSVAFSQEGLLAVANHDDSTLSVFSVDKSTGALSEVSGSPLATGAAPLSTAFSPDGGLLVSTSQTANTVSVFSVGPPSVRISAPAPGGTYTIGQKVVATFSCADAAYAPGIRRCRDSNGSPSPGQLDTAHAGKFTYRVTAVSKDGQEVTRSITYTVLPLTVGAVQVSGTSADVPLACPRQPESSCQATLVLKTTNPADTLHEVTVGQASTTLAAGQQKTVIVQLNATGKRLYKRRGGLQATLTVTQSGTVVGSKVLRFRS